ncbi:hypothetical protein CY34DRAFT_540850 [Suillus luteus UH-Slu-Lm8-n1]|uniref:DUF6533 domain-containing protein n=1 Tax=Suillus luteus UH-Slu-Lm8-n1 TaxID=930992 RepID=A0A0D0AUI8_9AGAM|nr:hypothetical protein CY34DRAFT_540850 [Suillus luteus UH-Slu-Lm8-n1]
MIFLGLTFGQEVELIWRQRWSLMTFIYLSVRYAGMGYALTNILLWVPTIQVMDIVSNVINDATDWTREVVDVLLGVIIIARLYAMYQRSRKMLIFLIVVFLAIRITNAVIVAIMMTQVSGEEAILSGTYQCMMNYTGDFLFLMSMTWILATVWEVLALCLALWITVKHFRELRKSSRKTSLQFLVLKWVICLQRSLRTGVTWNLRFMLVSLKSPYSCRYLCWDHALSLVCENAALNSQPK